ncbi:MULTISPECIES: hypothetical protein [Bacillus]|uniref:hypothetical protein n=1 Tax=Bacillus TaxID=1386 RepID=UPI00035FE8A0|nr:MULTISPECIES: hypothetical protein [Bacillus]PDZ73718.1 hypothetical protein CON58_10625 [Bacillus pseudomycoides]PEO49779.1 hypothetical protein CN559_09510 [Bacillus pseudomycoides]PEP55963.1 hypothetical protein CN564_19640 [Bacillus pseudomycoides]PGR96628.1 hypothetical protein COC54_26020 [Bacillus pseudomycoides]PHC92056.1 hypothetical protein COF36_21980 [Bacillus pseudomycoides]
MDTNITLNMAMNIAIDYKSKYNLSGDILENLERTIKFYSEFDSVNGPVWLVIVSIEPNDFFAENEYTIVISDKEAAVKYIIDPNGHIFSPHLETMTDEEFEEIFGDEEKEN